MVSVSLSVPLTVSAEIDPILIMEITAIKIKKCRIINPLTFQMNSFKYPKEHLNQNIIAKNKSFPYKIQLITGLVQEIDNERSWWGAMKHEG